MRKTFVFLFASSLIFYSCGSSEEKKALTEKENYELTKKNLRDKEIKSPQNFLTVTGSDKHNLVGQMVIKGVVANKATVAVYKDVDVQLDFYSKTGALQTATVALLATIPFITICPITLCLLLPLTVKKFCGFLISLSRRFFFVSS